MTLKQQRLSTEMPSAFQWKAVAVSVESRCLFNEKPTGLSHRGDVELADLAYFLVALHHADAEMGFAVFQTVVGLHEGCVPDAFARLYRLHVHVWRDGDVAVARCLHHRRHHVVERVVAAVVDLEDDLAYPAALYLAVLVVVHEARVLYLYVGSVFQVAGEVLHARLHRHGHVWLLGAVAAAVVGALEVVDAVVASVVGVETAVGVVGAACAVGVGALAPCLPLSPSGAHVGDVGVALCLLFLVGCLTYRRTSHGTANHAHQGAHVAAARPSGYAADGGTEDAAKGTAHIDTGTRISVATAEEQQSRHADDE